MKLLLDENLPKKLKYRFPNSFDVKTVPEMNWGGIKNCDLLKKMNVQNFRILIPMDKNFSHQQNLAKFSISLIILDSKDNRYEGLVKFISQLLSLLNTNMVPGLHILNNIE